MIGLLSTSRKKSQSTQSPKANNLDLSLLTATSAHYRGTFLFHLCFLGTVNKRFFTKGAAGLTEGFASSMHRQTTFFSLYLKELRYRAFYVFLSLCCSFFLGTSYANPLTHLLCTPFSSSSEKQPFSFIFTHVTEGFYAAVDVSLMYTCSLCLPFIIYQLYSFFMPSCYQGERRMVNLVLFCAALLFLLSLYTAFVFLLPKVCTFLQQFQYESKCMEIRLQPRIAPAVRWCCTAFLFTAIFFQIPLLLALLLRWEIIEYKFLREKRRYIFFSLLLISSLLSPPDVSSQCLVALSGFISYELFLWFALFHQQWHRKQLLLSTKENRRCCC